MVSSLTTSALKALQKKDVWGVVVQLGYDHNPARKVRFFGSNTDKSYTISKEQVSLLLPSQFQEKRLRFYCRHEKDRPIGKKIFKSFYQHYQGNVLATE